MTGQIQIFGLSNLPEISEGDDVGGSILEAASQAGLAFVQDDVIVVKQKIVSKAEGRIVLLADVQPSDLACRIAVKWDKDPRHVEVVLRESNRIVKMDQGIIISENRQGMVCANAGVDASNVGVDEAVCLLPEDSDTSAKAIRATLEKGSGVSLAVIVSDSIGRPWRNGIIDLAIGVSGLEPVRDYVGQSDDYGYELKVTTVAIADELASAAELVTGKLERTPVAVIRGYTYARSDTGAAGLIMEPERDLFR